MSSFGERKGSASYSRDLLLRKQADRLLEIAYAAKELPEFRVFLEPGAQELVNRMIISEQFPRRRILPDELRQLDNLKGLLRHEDMSKVNVVKEVALVSTNA